MNITDTKRLELLGKTWEQYRQKNDERLSDLEKKGAADPLTVEALRKINDSIEQLQVSMARPGMESKSAPFLTSEDREYKNAFNSYVRKGSDGAIANLETKSLVDMSITDGGGAYGGYMVTPNMQQIITDEVNDTCLMRKICSIQEISSPSFDVIDNADFATSWNSETGTVPDGVSTSTLTKKTINTYDLLAQPRVTQKLLDDASINMEEWLANQLAVQFAGAEEDAFINGVGDSASQPRGILSYENGMDADKIEYIESESASAGDVTVDDIMNMFYSLPEKYVGRASFVMSRGLVQKVRSLKDSASGRYLWQPGLISGSDDTLLGCPVYQSAFMPAPGTSSLSAILGDFNFYQIVDRTGIRILRDPYTAKPHVRFYTTKRVGGDVIRTDAFRILKCGE